MIDSGVSQVAATAIVENITLDDTVVASGLALQLIMVNVKKRKGRVVIDSDSEDSASDDNLDQVGVIFTLFPTGGFWSWQQFQADANVC